MSMTTGVPGAPRASRWCRSPLAWTKMSRMPVAEVIWNSPGRDRRIVRAHMLRARVPDCLERLPSREAICDAVPVCQLGFAEHVTEIHHLAIAPRSEIDQAALDVLDLDAE